MTKTNVLFVCQHNAGRSQLGAALLELLASDEYTVTSAGLTPATQVNPAIAATIAELGLDISDRIPRAVTTEELATADVVIAMKPGLALPAVPSGRYLQWEFPDPADWSTHNVRPLREAVAVQIRTDVLKR
jgi:arsenate reductase (thioredoxin)